MGWGGGGGRRGAPYKSRRPGGARRAVMERQRTLPTAPLALLCSIFSGCRGLPVVQAAEKQRQPSMAGTWVNDLGSKMVIDGPATDGSFRGTYMTAVAASEKPIRESPLYGVQQPGQQQPTFGFTVRWTFTDSTTVFVGQHFMDPKGKETLETIWLLRDKADSQAHNWKATRIGGNVFTRA